MAAATAASYTHCLCPGVSAPSPAPHLRALRSPEVCLRSKHPGHPLHQYSWAQPSARHPPTACGGSIITGSRGSSRPPAHAHCRAGNREERGRTLRARYPATLPLKSPQQAAWHSPRLSQELMAMSPPRNPTAKALLARPGAQPSARRPPAARGGSIIMGPRGASRPPACTHAVGPGTGKSGGGPYALTTPPRSRSRVPSKPHGVSPSSVRSPWPRHRLENPTAKALLARPGAQPSARRPPTARGGSVITGPRGASRPPTRTHAVWPGTGKSGGRPYALATPPRSRSRAPSKPHGVRPASVRGPWPRHCLENPTTKALLARPGAQPSARCPPAAR